MDEQEATLQTKAARTCGEVRSCLGKIKNTSYHSALRHSENLNRSKNKRSLVEPYFCPFCKKWHVGKVFPLTHVQKLALICDIKDVEFFDFVDEDILASLA